MEVGCGLVSPLSSVASQPALQPPGDESSDTSSDSDSDVEPAPPPQPTVLRPTMPRTHTICSCASACGHETAGAVGEHTAGEDGEHARRHPLAAVDPLCSACGNIVQRPAMPNHCVVDSAAAGPILCADHQPDAPRTLEIARRGGRFFQSWTDRPQPVPGRDPIALIRESLCSRDSLWT